MQTNKHAKMKITVVTDKAGNIVATAQHPFSTDSNSPKLHMIATDEQEVHTLHFEVDLRTVKSVDDWHKVLRRSLPSSKKAKRAQPGVEPDADGPG